MKTTLKENFETVTYGGDSIYPELSGYGDFVGVSIEVDNEDLKTLTVTIGGYKFLPEQIEDMLKLINKTEGFYNK